MGEEPLLRRLVPVLRKAHPVPDPLVTDREELVRRDRGLAVVGIVLRRERGKGQRPRLALATTLGLVGQDAEEPGAERGSPSEAIDTLEDADPGFLGDLFGNRLVGDKEAGESHEPRVIAVDEGGEGLLVATTQGEEQLLVVILAGISRNVRWRGLSPGQHRTSFSSPSRGATEVNDSADVGRQRLRARV